jgi:hypothetical protein
MSGVIFRAKDTERLLQDIASQWNNRSAARGPIATCPRKLDVQIYIADALAQGVANGYELDVDARSIAALLRANVSNSDRGLACVAISGLSYVPNSSDLKHFSELIKSSDDCRRSAAIDALALNCSPEAAALLQEVRTPDVSARVTQVSAVRQLKCANRKP